MSKAIQTESDSFVTHHCMCLEAVVNLYEWTEIHHLCSTLWPSKQLYWKPTNIAQFTHTHILYYEGSPLFQSYMAYSNQIEGTTSTTTTL